MNITKSNAAFTTDDFQVFAVRCVLEPKDDYLPRDVYLAFYHPGFDEPHPQPVCTVTILNCEELAEHSSPTSFTHVRTLEWVQVPEKYRRQGIATEVVVAIQDHIGPLCDCDHPCGAYKLYDDWPECGRSFFDAIRDTLLGNVPTGGDK